jgi:sarcosine oxidase
LIVKLNIVIVGGGVMGCAAALAAVRAGHRVRLLEMHCIGSEFGSSHGATRIIRLSYGRSDYIPLARRSFALWRELEHETQQKLITLAGGIDVARPGTKSFTSTMKAMSSCGVPFEAWDFFELRRAYPQFNFSEDVRACYQKDTAILHADSCIATMIRLAKSLGAVIEEHQAVVSVMPEGRGVAVKTKTDLLRADRLVLCAGPEMPGFLASLDLQIPLIVSKEQYSYLKVRDAEQFKPGAFPICIQHSDSTVLSSIFPADHLPAVKMMIERKTPVVDPLDFAVDSENEAAVRESALNLMPGSTGEILKTKTCRYTLTKDEDFIIDRHPEHEQIVLCSACSGHGFKFGIAIGEMLLALATGASLAPAPALFSLSRPALH